MEAKTYGLGKSTVNGRDQYILSLNLSTIYSSIKLASADISAEEPLLSVDLRFQGLKPYDNEQKTLKVQNMIHILAQY